MIFLEDRSDWEWDEVKSRKNFKDNISGKKEKLLKIIGAYQFREKIKCGLKECKSPHLRGYIVITENGTETNIGNCCGKKYFGVHFDNLSKNFSQHQKDYKGRQDIFNAQKNLPHLSSYLNKIIGNKDKLLKTHLLWENVTNANYVGSTIARKLRELCSKNSTLITISVENNDERKKDILSSFSNKSQKKYDNLFVGNIKYIEAVAKKHDIKKTLNEIESDIKEISECNELELHGAKLKKISKISNELNNKIKLFEQDVSLVKRFLKKENMVTMMLLLQSLPNSYEIEEEKKLFRKFLEKLK